MSTASATPCKAEGAAPSFTATTAAPAAATAAAAAAVVDRRMKSSDGTVGGEGQIDWERGVVRSAPWRGESSGGVGGRKVEVRQQADEDGEGDAGVDGGCGNDGRNAGRGGGGGRGGSRGLARGTPPSVLGPLSSSPSLSASPLAAQVGPVSYFSSTEGVQNVFYGEGRGRGCRSRFTEK